MPKDAVMRAMTRLSDHRVLMGTVNRGGLNGGGVGIGELMKLLLSVRPANWAEM